MSVTTRRPGSDAFKCSSVPLLLRPVPSLRCDAPELHFSVPRLLWLKVENVQHHGCASIQQHDIAANHKMRISNRRRRQTLFQFLRASNHLLPQSWRECSAHDELSFQAGRQLVPLSQTRREVVAMFMVPATYFVAIAITVVMTVPVFVAIAVFVVTATVTVTVSLSLPLSKSHSAGNSAGKREQRGRAHM